MEPNSECCNTNNWNIFRLGIMLLLYILKHQLTNSMGQSPSWEANRSSASQKIPRILRNPELHYRIYSRRPLVQILSQSIQSTEPSKMKKKATF